MIQKLRTPALAAPLFGDWPEGILWACLQGRMGDVYVTEPMASAAAVLGDFSFFAGMPDESLLDAVSAPLLIPQHDGWADAITAHFGRGVQAITRYATRKDTVFDRKMLQAYANRLPLSYTIRIINRELYNLCSRNTWSRDLVSQYPTWECFQAMGLGCAVLRGQTLASGASSYAAFDGGIEIEIDTHPDFRRLGLARACGAALILRCLDRGLYPSWDAQNPISLTLAKQLGYTPGEPYRTFVKCSPLGEPVL